MRGRLIDGLIAAVAFSCSIPAIAIGQDDLPTRVGRVSDFAGALYLASESASDWAPVGQNYPVAASDRLWVAPEGRAEIDFGSSQMRLAGDTQVQIATLDEHRFALFVASGRVVLRVRTLEAEDSAVIDTPQTQIRLDRPGSYRIEVDSDRKETELAVGAGEAHMRYDGGTRQVWPGQTAALAASDGSRVEVVDRLGTDGFDAWSIARDRIYDGFRAAYVSREMVGAVDLDAYGNWENHPTYGNVWFPTVVAVGWAPYRFCHWVWCGPWRWTWVDDASWGYAPFHYGRWVYVSGRWGWCPGAFSRHPVWAPALVAWLGGPGWAPSVGGGAPIFGWVPLAWGEALTPLWRCSEKCWRGLNEPVAAIDRHPRNRFANGEAPGALSAVAASVVSEGKPVAFHLVRVSRSSLAAAWALDDAPAIRAHPIPMARHPSGAPAIGPRIDPITAHSGRIAAPSPAPREAGRHVSTPAHEDSMSQRQLSSGAPRTYGGVPDGRGAYTGVVPTPGPKPPPKSDARFAVVPPVGAPREALPHAVPAITRAPALVAPGPLLAAPVSPAAPAK